MHYKCSFYYIKRRRGHGKEMSNSQPLSTELPSSSLQMLKESAAQLWIKLVPGIANWGNRCTQGKWGLPPNWHWQAHHSRKSTGFRIPWDTSIDWEQFGLPDSYVQYSLGIWIFDICVLTAQRLILGWRGNESRPTLRMLMMDILRMCRGSVECFAFDFQIQRSS